MEEDRLARLQKVQRLTAQERHLLELRGQGKELAEIATHLNIAVPTVKSRFAKIWDKLEIADVGRAARMLEIAKFCEVLSNPSTPDPAPQVAPEPAEFTPPAARVAPPADQRASATAEGGMTQYLLPREPNPPDSTQGLADITPLEDKPVIVQRPQKLIHAKQTTEHGVLKVVVLSFLASVWGNLVAAWMQNKVLVGTLVVGVSSVVIVVALRSVSSVPPATPTVLPTTVSASPTAVVTCRESAVPIAITVPANGVATSQEFVTSARCLDINLRFTSLPEATDVRAVQCSSQGDWSSSWKPFNPGDTGWAEIATNMLDGTCFHLEMRGKIGHTYEVGGNLAY